MRQLTSNWRHRPLGLPEGSVRAFLAIGLTIVTAYMWLKGLPVSESQLAVNSMLFGYYFGARKAAQDAQVVQPNTEVEP